MTRFLDDFAWLCVENLKKHVLRPKNLIVDPTCQTNHKKYEEIKTSVNLKGFRPGKVPKEILKRQFGKAVFNEVLDKVLKDSSTKALEENKIKLRI